MTFLWFLQEVIVAIENDDAGKVRECLEGGLDPNSRYNDTTVSDGDADDTLLHWAARYDSSETAKVRSEPTISAINVTRWF